LPDRDGRKGTWLLDFGEKDEKRLEANRGLCGALGLQIQAPAGNFLLLPIRQNAGFTARDLTMATSFHIKKRRRKVRVAEASLNLPAIRAAFERVVRVGMADPMRACITTITQIDRALRRRRECGPGEKPTEHLPEAIGRE